MLRMTYRINALATFACGLVLLAAGSALAPLFALSAPILHATGGAFVLLAVYLFALSRQVQPAFGAALFIGAIDAAYALASFAALALDWSLMTPALRFAVAFVAVPVALFAAVEVPGALKLRPAARLA